MKYEKNSNGVNFSVSYNSSDDSWIDDSIYADIAAAAEVLFNCQQDYKVNKEMQKLAEIDQFVADYGTELANVMLAEHFKY